MATALLDTLNDAGLHITLLPPDRLSVSPVAFITDSIRALIRANKPEIICSLLAINDNDINSLPDITILTIGRVGINDVLPYITDTANNNLTLVAQSPAEGDKGNKGEFSPDIEWTENSNLTLVGQSLELTDITYITDKNGSGTRRPPDLSSKLLAASKALDRQLLEHGYSLELPPEPPLRKICLVTPATPVTPPPRKLGHFDIDAPWRPAARAYYNHHVNCKQCIAAGRGSRYGRRCGVGASLQRIAP